MKKMLFYLLAFMPLSMMAQDDDLYFVPKKKASVEVVTDNYGLPKDTYYEGSNRSVDEYNRRMRSSYTEIAGDSSKVDVIDFNGQKGVYPDSLKNGVTRFDDYVLTDNEAFWAGYRKGVNDWGWHSPWYCSYYDWYDPWYYPYWYGGWYRGWYTGWYGSVLRLSQLPDILWWQLHNLSFASLSLSTQVIWLRSLRLRIRRPSYSRSWILWSQLWFWQTQLIVEQNAK